MNTFQKVASVVGGGAVLASGVYLMNSPSDSSAPSTRDADYSTTRSYEETGDRDCPDFKTKAEAQRFFIAEGGPDKDFHGLDRDGDGKVCENLP